MSGPCCRNTRQSEKERSFGHVSSLKIVRRIYPLAGYFPSLLLNCLSPRKARDPLLSIQEMSAAAASAQPAVKPCGRTQSKLDELLKGADKGEARFERFFFTAAPPRHLAHLHINDDLVRCLKCGCTIDEHAADASRPCNDDAARRSVFVCHAVIPNCKKMSGIRSLVYSTAQTHLARYRNTSSPQNSIVYTGEDLHVCVAFSTEASGGNFRNAILALGEPPALLKGISCSIVADSVVEIGDYIVKTDYKPTDSDSPFNSLQCLQRLSDSSCSVVTKSNDLFKYQMLENPCHPTLAKFLPERAHIIADGRRYRDGDPADNYLALYRVPMHQLFDGIETEGNIPQVMLVPGTVGSKDPTTLRTPVEIVVCCNSQSTYEALAQFMQIGAVHDAPNHMITCTVFVEHPEVFCANLRKRAAETEQAWGRDIED